MQQSIETIEVRANVKEIEISELLHGWIVVKFCNPSQTRPELQMNDYAILATFYECRLAFAHRRHDL